MSPRLSSQLGSPVQLLPWEILLWPRSWPRPAELLWRALPHSCSLYGPGRSLWGKESPFQKPSCGEYILVFWTPVSGAAAVASAVAAGAAPVAPVPVPGAGARLPPLPGSRSGTSPPPLPRPWSAGNTDSLSASGLHPWAPPETLLSDKHPEHQHSPAPAAHTSWDSWYQQNASGLFSLLESF